MNCVEADRVLDAYVDEELEAADAAGVRAHLDVCGACRQRVGARVSLSRLIRRIPYYEAPDRLRVAVAIASRPRRLSPRVLAWAATVVLAVSLGSGAVPVMIHRTLLRS